MIQALKTVIPVRKKEKPKEKKQVLLAVSEEEARERLTFFEKEASDSPISPVESTFRGRLPSMGTCDRKA